MTDAAMPRPGWQQVLHSLGQPKVAVMLLLGFSSGIPIYLVGNTLGFWMRENGIELSVIGFLTWVGIAYSLKFVWAPFVDKFDAPLFGRLLGRRRGWMLFSQLVVAAGLLAMAYVEPKQGGLLVAGLRLDHLLVFGTAALVVAFASATQDIVIDAWRIEIASSNEQQGLLTSAATLGYRGALLITDALILILAAHVGWVLSYAGMAALMAVGMVAVLWAREPAVDQTFSEPDVLGISNAMVVRWVAGAAVGLALAIGLGLWITNPQVPSIGGLAATALGVLAFRWLFQRPSGPVLEATWARPLALPMARLRDGMVSPFVAFVSQHGARSAALMMLAISLYRLPDFVMGPMANPFYSDLGLAKETVGAVRGSIGLVATVVGVVVAGLSAVRLGFVATLLIGAVLGPGSNVAFSYLALHGGDPGVFAWVMAIDNFCSGFAGVALIGYMSSLTQLGYTATQYALLSSLYALLGKLLKGLSGWTVEQLEVGRPLLEAYSLFFAGTALIGLPALLLCVLLIRREGHRKLAQVG
jgi:MFS transporter, PAT family, beta-lactamase induction signal transducer AmpG